MRPPSAAHAAVAAAMLSLGHPLPAVTKAATGASATARTSCAARKLQARRQAPGQTADERR